MARTRRRARYKNLQIGVLTPINAVKCMSGVILRVSAQFRLVLCLKRDGTKIAEIIVYW